MPSKKDHGFSIVVAARKAIGEFDPEVPASRRMVLIALALRADPDKNGKCWGSREKLARYCGISLRTCQTALLELEAMGQITIVRGNRTRADHFLVHPFSSATIADDVAVWEATVADQEDESSATISGLSATISETSAMVADLITHELPKEVLITDLTAPRDTSSSAFADEDSLEPTTLAPLLEPRLSLALVDIGIRWEELFPGSAAPLEKIRGLLSKGSLKADWFYVVFERFRRRHDDSRGPASPEAYVFSSVWQIRRRPEGVTEWERMEARDWLQTLEGIHA